VRNPFGVPDMAAITRLANEAGALMLWDLSQSDRRGAGRLDADEVDLAVGCTYKYLSGGPGAPAFPHVARRHQDSLRQRSGGGSAGATRLRWPRATSRRRGSPRCCPGLRR
jgi:kynureninase